MCVAGGRGGRSGWRAAVRGAAGAADGVLPRLAAGAATACGQARACVRWAGRGATGLGLRPLAGSAAPPIRARQCRAKIGGAADPATPPVSAPVVATSASRHANMHGAAQTFCHAMAIDAAKSVSFEEEKNSVRFKISLKKC